MDFMDNMFFVCLKCLDIGISAVCWSNSLLLFMALQTASKTRVLKHDNARSSAEKFWRKKSTCMKNAFPLWVGLKWAEDGWVLLLDTHSFTPIIYSSGI